MSQTFAHYQQIKGTFSNVQRFPNFSNSENLSFKAGGLEQWLKQCLQAFLNLICRSRATSAMWCRGSRALRGPSVPFWKNSRSLELALPLWTCTGATIAWSCFCLPPDGSSGSFLLSFLRESAWSCLLTIKQDGSGVL